MERRELWWLLMSFQMMWGKVTILFFFYRFQLFIMLVLPVGFFWVFLNTWFKNQLTDNTAAVGKKRKCNILKLVILQFLCRYFWTRIKKIYLCEFLKFISYKRWFKFYPKLLIINVFPSDLSCLKILTVL